MRITIPFILVPVLLLALAIPSSADFKRVRAIPASPGTCSLNGLDNTGSVLFAAGQPCDCTSCSMLYLLDPSDGSPILQRSFPEPSRLLSCAYAGPNVYWVGDACGRVIKIYWAADSLSVLESFMLPGCRRNDEGDNRPPQPSGMVCESRFLHIVDPVYRCIEVYDDSSHEFVGAVPLPCAIRQASSLTFFRGNYLVASAACDTVYELDRTGVPVRSHRLEGLGPRSPRGITFLGDYLYVSSTSDSIVVFEPFSFTTEVPPGDSVAVDAVPGEVEVVFDSVSTGGTLDVEIAGSDPCPVPAGVVLFPNFYQITTDAFFDYAAEVIISRSRPLPEGVDPNRVRIFVRPSGECVPFRDITTAPPEVALTLTTLTRTKSEDDEFSVFVLGEDLRDPKQVVEFKFEYLEGAIDGGRASIPTEALVRILGLVAGAHDAYYRGSSLKAAALLDSLAGIVRATPSIPHTFDPGLPGQNLAGRLISDAHTLAFSLWFSADQGKATGAVLVPSHIGIVSGPWVKCYIDLPPGFESAEVDSDHIYLEHLARALPESTSVGDYDSDEQPEIRAIFPTSAVRAAMRGGPRPVARITCFAGGFEVYADAAISVTGGTPAILDGEPVIGGKTPRIAASNVPGAAGLAEPGLVITPNPSASSFALRVTAVEGEHLEVCLYSVEGELVRSLFSGRAPYGPLELSWNGEGNAGEKVSPGAYFMVVRSGGRFTVRKVVLQR